VAGNLRPGGRMGGGLGGAAHPDIGLGAGTVLRSMGNLDLDAYGQLLTTSAVGVA